MTKIIRLINRRIERDRLDDSINLHLTGRCPIRSWEEAKIIVECMIFFDKKNDVLDGLLCVRWFMRA